MAIKTVSYVDEASEHRRMNTRSLPFMSEIVDVKYTRSDSSTAKSYWTVTFKYADGSTYKFS